MAEKLNRVPSKNILNKRIRMIVRSVHIKERLLYFLRHYHPLSDSLDSEPRVSAGTWVAKIPLPESDVSEQALEENEDIVHEQGLDTELLEQLVLKLTKLEEKIFVLVKYLKHLDCGICKSHPMAKLEVTDSGELLCKACIMHRFTGGSTSYPVTQNTDTEHVVVRVDFNGMAPSPVDAGPSDEVESSVGESSSISDELIDQPLSVAVKDRVKLLSLQAPKVLRGLRDLVGITNVPGGKYEVFKAGAIPKAVELTGTMECTNRALELLKAVTSFTNGDADVPERDKTEIFEAVADHLDVLMKIMEQKKDPAALHAAETVVNMLTNNEIWHTVRTRYHIVKALVELSDRADSVRLQGLARLTKVDSTSHEYSKIENIAISLVTLLQEGLERSDLENLVNDSLEKLKVLVIDQVIPIDSVYPIVRKKMLDLMTTNKFESISSILGRTAFIRIMTKHCTLYKEDITESLLLGIMRMMERTVSEMSKLKAKEIVTVRDLEKLLNLFVELLCIFATHQKKLVETVFTQNVRVKGKLRNMAVDQNLKISVESRVEILLLFGQIDIPSSQDILAEGITLLGKMATSPVNKEKVAAGVRKIVVTRKGLTEIQLKGVVEALLGLLKDTNENCQQDALIALQALPPGVAIPNKMLLPEICFKFLDQSWRKETRNAAIGLLFLAVKEGVVRADTFVQTEGAMEASLSWLRQNMEKPGSQEDVAKAAFAILKMAADEYEEFVRLRIEVADLKILIGWVQQRGTEDLKELLTNALVLILESGTANKESLTKIGAHNFLLDALRNEKLKLTAVKGFEHLVTNENSRKDVLTSGFVEKAVESINSKFAPSGIARILKQICSSGGLEWICQCPNIVSKLLILLEHCPEPDGKGSTATTIAEVYVRLRNDERTSIKRNEMILVCCHLLQYLGQDDQSQVGVVLETLEVLATEDEVKEMILKKNVFKCFHKYLTQASAIRDLVIKILVKMSSVFEDGKSSDYSIRMGYAFASTRIAEQLCGLVKTELESRGDDWSEFESMKNLLILIRNLSCHGPIRQDQLCKSGAVDILLSIVQNHQRFSSIVTALSVQALDTCIETVDLKKDFLKSDGIGCLCGVLKTSFTGNVSDALIISKSILALFVGSETSVVRADPTSKRACKKILSCDILPELHQIIHENSSDDLALAKFHVGVLFYCLVLNSPLSRNFPSNDSIVALIHLRAVGGCEKMANQVLEHLRGSGKECRKRIDQLIKVNKLLYE